VFGYFSFELITKYKKYETTTDIQVVYVLLYLILSDFEYTGIDVMYISCS